MIRHGGIYVMVQPNAETLTAIEDVNLKRNLFGPYKSREALREALDSENDLIQRVYNKA